MLKAFNGPKPQNRDPQHEFHFGHGRFPERWFVFFPWQLLGYTPASAVLFACTFGQNSFAASDGLSLFFHAGLAESRSWCWASRGTRRGTMRTARTSRRVTLCCALVYRKAPSTSSPRTGRYFHCKTQTNKLEKARKKERNVREMKSRKVRETGLGKKTCKKTHSTEAQTIRHLQPMDFCWERNRKFTPHQTPQHATLVRVSPMTGRTTS